MSMCSICYQAVAEEDEAFVEGCLHRFCFSCISQWSERQLKGNSGSKALVCPLCRQPYTSVLHDCSSSYFRRHTFIKGAAVGSAKAAPEFAPSAQQLRRRSLYYSNKTADSAGQPDTSEVSLTALHRPQVAAWIERELQALLLDSDVSIVAQHTLGTLSAAFPASPQRTRGPGLGSPPQANTASRDKFLEVVAAATAAYLKESAGQFASELWKFVASGLSIQAHDRLVFGTRDVEDGQHAKGPLMTAAGMDKEEGELSGEELQRRESDGMDLSLSYHTDGYDSQDSEAYIPLVRSALEQKATSRDAACTSEGTSKRPQGTSKVPDTAANAGEGAGVSLREAEGRSGAGTPDSAAVAVKWGSDANHSADEGPVKERSIMQDSGEALLPVDGSAKIPNSERGEPGARQGTGGKKRKVKHKHNNKHKRKRRKSDDLEGCDEEDRADRAETTAWGSAGQAAVCNAQSLEDLMRAAQKWASKVRGDSADGEDSVAPQDGTAVDGTTTDAKDTPAPQNGKS